MQFDGLDVKQAMQERRGLRLEELTREALQAAGCMDVVMAIPQDFMERVSYVGNLLAQMTMDSKGIKDDRLRLVVGRLCQALSYMMNSCSWREGQLHDFDYQEVTSKLGRLIQLPQELIEKFEKSGFCPHDMIRGRPETGTAWNTLEIEYDPGSESHYSGTSMYYVLHHDGNVTRAERPWGEMSGKDDGEFIKAVVDWFQSMTQAKSR